MLVDSVNRIEYNQIVLSREDFGDDLWNVVGQQLSILTRAGNICVVYDDDVDIVIIQYEHDDIHPKDNFGYYGVCNPIWLSYDEIQNIESERQSLCNKEDNTEEDS